MKKRKLFWRIMAVVLLLWLGCSIFAFSRHNISEQVMSIDEYVKIYMTYDNDRWYVAGLESQ